MKRILFAFLILILVFTAAIYLLIPNRVHIYQQRPMLVNKDGLMRNLALKQEWAKWWPGVNNAEKGFFSFGSRNYEPLDPKVLSIPFRVSAGDMQMITDITAVAAGEDSSVVMMDYTVPTSYNPFRRIQRYFTARSLRRDAASMLSAMSSHYATIKNMYGYDIRKDHVVDSTLLTNIKEINGQPGTDMIYGMVAELKSYIKSQGALETGLPMLNVFTKDSTRYLVKVAIPVNKKLPDSGTMSYRWMLGGGNILITEVKGGPAAIRKAYHQIELYIGDHNRVAPAIPFESLVTDRKQQPDSNQWVTRIYYPVM